MSKSAHSMKRDQASLYARIDALVAERQAQLVEMRHHFHAHPELSNREKQTSAFIANHLRSLGLDEVRTGIAGHGVVGVLRGKQPGNRVMALRADMDALPVRETSGVPFASTAVDKTYPGGPFPVAHACGHDCHSATVLTTASVLSALRDDLPGSVLFIFQPAEEGPPFGETGGAQAMLDAGALADSAPTMVFGMHVAPMPKGAIGYRTGYQYAASCLVKIVVTGVQVHGATPWLGVDPMPPAAEIISGAGQLYRQVPAYDPITISISHVEDMGRFNIVGESVTLWGTIRAIVDSDMAVAQQRLKRLAEHIAAAYGCSAEVDYLQPVPALRNSRAWIEALLPTLRRVAGDDHLFEAPPALNYDDVSVFVNTFGGAYLMYGVQDARRENDQFVAIEGGRGLIPNHNPGFYADDQSLGGSVRIHAHVAVDRLTGRLDVNGS